MTCPSNKTHLEVVVEIQTSEEKNTPAVILVLSLTGCVTLQILPPSYTKFYFVGLPYGFNENIC